MGPRDKPEDDRCGEVGCGDMRKVRMIRFGHYLTAVAILLAIGIVGFQGRVPGDDRVMYLLAVFVSLILASAAVGLAACRFFGCSRMTGAFVAALPFCVLAIGHVVYRKLGWYGRHIWEHDVLAPLAEFATGVFGFLAAGAFLTLNPLIGSKSK
jgi:hypothetical protein